LASAEEDLEQRPGFGCDEVTDTNCRLREEAVQGFLLGTGLTTVAASGMQGPFETSSEAGFYVVSSVGKCEPGIVSER